MLHDKAGTFHVEWLTVFLIAPHDGVLYGAAGRSCHTAAVVADNVAACHYAIVEIYATNCICSAVVGNQAVVNCRGYIGITIIIISIMCSINAAGTITHVVCNDTIDNICALCEYTACKFPTV